MAASADPAVHAALTESDSAARRAGGIAQRVLLPTLTVVALVGLWWLAAIVFGWEEFVVPTPSDVWAEFRAQQGTLPTHVRVTLVETLQGFALAILIAVPVAVAIAYSNVLEGDDTALVREGEVTTVVNCERVKTVAAGAKPSREEVRQEIAEARQDVREARRQLREALHELRQARRGK